jgi:hypothetical protein
VIEDSIEHLISKATVTIVEEKAAKSTTENKAPVKAAATNVE